MLTGSPLLETVSPSPTGHPGPSQYRYSVQVPTGLSQCYRDSRGFSLAGQRRSRWYRDTQARPSLNRPVLPVRPARGRVGTKLTDRSVRIISLAVIEHQNK